VAEQTPTQQIKFPRGAFETKCDDKGRIKLPAVFRQYLEDIGESSVFVTTTDKLVARIYPNSVWSANERFFESNTEHPEEVRMVARTANHYGQDFEMDGQGRVLIPTNLRRELGLEGSSVWLQFSSGAFDVYSDAYYQQCLSGNGTKTLSESNMTLKKAGFK